MAPALAGGFFTTKPPGKPGFKIDQNSSTTTEYNLLFFVTAVNTTN